MPHGTIKHVQCLPRERQTSDLNSASPLTQLQVPELQYFSFEIQDVFFSLYIYFTFLIPFLNSIHLETKSQPISPLIGLQLESMFMDLLYGINYA